MDPPDLSVDNIVTMNYTNGSLVQFNDVVRYECTPGYHFESSYEKDGFELKCYDTGLWDTPDGDKCVDPSSKH